MTFANYRLPIPRERRMAAVTAPLVPAELVIIVPAKDDPDGLAVTLASLANLSPGPSKVVVVDDGSRVPLVPPASFPWPLDFLRSPINRGAASARNQGAAKAPSWIYFTDTDCEHPKDLLLLLASARAAAGPGCVAVAAPVQAEGDGPIPQYMGSQRIMDPPADEGEPQAIITANAAVHWPTACLMGGFDESFPGAGGEDLDLGLRLRESGSIAWAPTATVRHRFPNDPQDFDRRFRRYGAAMARLEAKWKRPLRPGPIMATNPALQPWADRQAAAMLAGYEAGGLQD